MENGPDSLAIVLPILGPLLLAGVLLAFLAWRRGRRRRQAWSAFADRRGWDFTARGRLPTLLEAQGPHQGHQVSLLTESRGDGMRHHATTVLRVDLSDTVPLELSLTLPRSFSLLKAEVGDVALDDALEQQGANARSRRLLREDPVRRRLLEAHASYGHLSIDGGLLEVEHRGVPETLAALEAAVAPALALVDALDDAARQSRERRA